MNAPHPPRYSVVIPCYNSTQSISELVDALARIFTEHVKQSHEVILVDDGSENPDTWHTLQTLAKAHANVSATRFLRNFGKPNALICGFEQAQGEFIITMDDDLQHAPEDIPLLIAAEEHDLVIGAYPRRYSNPLVQCGSWIKNRLDSMITGKPVAIRMSPFRLMRRVVAKSVVDIKTPYPFVAALLFYVTRDIVSVEIPYRARKYGKSQYTLKKRFLQFTRLLINNSSLLLKLVAMIGVAMSVLAPLAGLWLIVRKLVWDLGVPGWTSLMLVLILIGGLMLASMGIIGEYLIRIIRAVEGRPTYIIREKI